MTLTCDSVVKQFGGVRAVDGVSCTVSAGEIVGLIGPNGSGKTTLVNVMSGFASADGGSVVLDGKRLEGRGPAVVRQMGVARTFQNLRLIEPLSVQENVLLGLQLEFTGGRRYHASWVAAALGTPAGRRRNRTAVEMAQAAIEELGLERLRDTPVQALSYGDRKRVELARVLAIRPKVLLLDEPTAGLDPDDATRLIETVVSLAEGRTDCATVIVEHRLDLIVRTCDRLIVLDSGRMIADGDPEKVASDPSVLSVYVGTGSAG